MAYFSVPNWNVYIRCLKLLKFFFFSPPLKSVEIFSPPPKFASKFFRPLPNSSVSCDCTGRFTPPVLLLYSLLSPSQAKYVLYVMCHRWRHVCHGSCGFTCHARCHMGHALYISLIGIGISINELVDVLHFLSLYNIDIVHLSYSFKLTEFLYSAIRSCIGFSEVASVIVVLLLLVFF